MNSLCKSQSSSGSLSYGMSISIFTLISVNYMIVKVQRHVYFNIIIYYFYLEWRAKKNKEKKRRNFVEYILQNFLLEKHFF